MTDRILRFHDPRDPDQVHAANTRSWKPPTTETATTLCGRDAVPGVEVDDLAVSDFDQVTCPACRAELAAHFRRRLSSYAYDSAYPTPENATDFGMTKREMMAMHLLGALIAADDEGHRDTYVEPGDYDRSVNMAVTLADDLLARLLTTKVGERPG